MIKKLQKRFALSEQGAKDTIMGSLESAFQNLTFLFPAGLLYLLFMDLSADKGNEHLPVYLVGCIICLVLMAVSSWLQYNGTYLATYLETGKRRIAVAEKLRKIPLSYFSKKDLADLTSSIMNDCTVLEKSQSHYVCSLAGSLISTTIIAIVLLFFDWRMALAALWVLPISFCIITFSSRVQKNLSRKASRAQVEFEDTVQESIEAMSDLRSNNAEDKALIKLEQKIRQVEKRSTATEFGTSSFITMANLVLKFGIATTALVGILLLVQGQTDILTFFFFLIVASRLYDPLDGALQNLSAIISTNTNIQRMDEILDYPLQEGMSHLTNQGYDIHFDHVGFAYQNGETVLKDVSFIAKQGEVTALVGPSGGGKTTVSRLAVRFWDIDTGKITVGGMNISEIDPETLMSLYSIVFQDVTLFNNTILENIRVGNPKATDQEVIQAAKLANVDEFAEKLPDKWNSMIGENGCELSGGERQRISIARAFLKNAPIILMDEATASLDVENETLIQTALSRLIKSKTVLVIAHRMRTVAGANKIIVLNDGIVAEQGTPTELMKRDGIFARMTKLQTESEKWVIS
ncbi:ABC transporter ATP-binding protein [Blautia luti]|uniref:ABC transporter ATP-binding protein n=1 Tax=Blautia luti TaxID=89014 RepID=UPI003D7A30F2